MTTYNSNKWYVFMYMQLSMCNIGTLMLIISRSEATIWDKCTLKKYSFIGIPMDHMNVSQESILYNDINVS